jgi:hypothetical protein
MLAGRMSDLARNGLMVEIALIWTWIADQVEAGQLRREDAVALAEERMFDLCVRGPRYAEHNRVTTATVSDRAPMDEVDGAGGYPVA